MMRWVMLLGFMFGCLMACAGVPVQLSPEGGALKAATEADMEVMGCKSVGEAEAKYGMNAGSSEGNLEGVLNALANQLAHRGATHIIKGEFDTYNPPGVSMCGNCWEGKATGYDCTPRYAMELKDTPPECPSGSIATVIDNGTTLQCLNASDQRHGPFVAYHSTGHRSLEATYKRGQIQGAVTTWHPTGEKESVGSYVDDLEDGEWNAWHTNGQMESQGAFAFGMETGTWRYWHDNGQLAGSGEYKDGAQLGLWMQWYADGTVKAELSYQAGELHGESSLYYEDGTLVERCKYFEGSQVNCEYE